MRQSTMQLGPVKTATLTAVLVFSATVTTAQDARPEDVATPESIVSAAYESIIRAPGESYDWDRFRSLHLPTAVLISNTEQSGGEFRPLTPEGFIAWIDAATTVGGENDRGFVEEIVHNVVNQYGDVAHVISTYRKRFYDSDEILGRGVNFFQLVYASDRWWIVSIIWDEENGAGPIPEQYLGE